MQAAETASMKAAARPDLTALHRPARRAAQPGAHLVLAGQCTLGALRFPAQLLQRAVVLADVHLRAKLQ